MNLMHQRCPDMTEIDLEWPIKPLSRLNALNLIQLNDFFSSVKRLILSVSEILCQITTWLYILIPYTFWFMTCSTEWPEALCTIRALRASPHKKWCSAIIKLIEWIIKLVEQPQIIINILNLSVNSYYKYIKNLSPKFWKKSNVFTCFQMSSSWRI